jgi:drug/metabolite transporter (DMT)-like permease
MILIHENLPWCSSPADYNTIALDILAHDRRIRSMGLFLAFIATTLSTSKDLISKRLASRLDGTASTFASFAFALPYYVVLLAVLWLLGNRTFALSLPFLGLVFLRSSTDTIAEGLKMHAFNHGDISVVSTFFSLAPLFLLIASPLITDDPLTLTEALAVVLCVAGSLALVYNPKSAGWGEQKKGIILATGAAVFFSLNSCFDRLAVQQDTLPDQRDTSRPVVAAFAMTLLSALFLLPVVLFNRERRAKMRAECGSLLLRGLLEAGFMTMKLTALQYLRAPEFVGIMRLSLLFAIIGGRVFFKEGDFGRRLAAGILIIAGVTLIAWLQM